MSRRSREKRVTLRGICEPSDNDVMDRAFAELNRTGQQGDSDGDAAASRGGPAGHEQAIARVGENAATMHAPMEAGR
ncbi:hypothetical protein SAMN03159335_06189 [Burkholderia cepacia]|nr:hypothetical protein SAMN03159335_06189 [Burkholderia cepacia]